MAKGKKSNINKSAVKLSPAERKDVTRLVDALIKKCSKVPLKNAFSAKQDYEDFQEIYDLVEKIRSIEKSLSLPKYDRGERLKEFSKWANENGIKSSKVRVDSCGSAGYGLTCNETIEQGETVLEVPVAAMMTEHGAAATYLNALISRDPLLQKMGNVRLAMHVLVEYLDPSSEWRPYVTALPQHFDTPLHFTPQHIQSLRHSSVLESVVKQYRNIGRQYAYFYRIIFSLPESRDWPLREYYSYDAYRWAVSCVSTRINSVPCSLPGKGPTQLALVPCWDLVNHRSSVMSTDFLDSEQKLVCYANSDFAPESQFTMHYGDRSNEDLFLHAAFVVKDNPHDSILLRLGLSKTDPLFDAKTLALENTATDRSRDFRIVPGEDPLSERLWAFAVVFSADEEFTTTITSGDKPLETLASVTTEPSRADLCVAAYKFLHTRIGLLLRAYPATSESEEKTSSSALDGLVSDLLREERSLLTNAHSYCAAKLASVTNTTTTTTTTS